MLQFTLKSVAIFVFIFKILSQSMFILRGILIALTIWAIVLVCHLQYKEVCQCKHNHLGNKYGKLVVFGSTTNPEILLHFKTWCKNHISFSNAICYIYSSSSNPITVATCKIPASEIWQHAPNRNDMVLKYYKQVYSYFSFYL
jgi:hypothetical protein